MAEAFGLAVNLATVVELSTEIAKACLQYSKDVKNAREDIARVEEKTLNLKVVAGSASELLKGPHGAALKTSRALLGAAREAASRLEALDAELQPSDARKAMRRFGVRALKWPFQSKHVENLVRDIERYTQMISTGLQIDQTTILLSLDQKFVLDKLPTVPEASFDSHAEEHNPTCLPSTRVELLKELDRWINDPDAEAVFWLNGMAGTGKSTISRTVAQSLAKTNQLGASFFFKRGEGDRGHASKFFTTVASQLASRLPTLALHVKNAIDADPAIHTKVLREQFNKLIREPFLKVQEAHNGAYVAVVVDALDECEQDSDIKAIIKLFSSDKSLKPLRLKVLLTSRPELPIRLGFSAVQGTYNDLVLHEIPAPVIEHDISTFLEHELGRIRDEYNSSVAEERRLSPDWPGQFNVQTLATMAVPLFIFAATTCRFLDQRRRGNPDQQLQRVLNYWNRSQEPKADLVSNFDLTYRPALDQQLTDLSPAERNEALQQFRHIVGAIILLSNPLSAGAVAELLNIPRHSVEDRLDMLHSVLDVPRDSASPVRLLHLSFRNFLIDPRYGDSNPFWIDEKEVHRQTATNCLRVMGDHLRGDILDLKAPGAPQSIADSLDIKAYLPPQAQYACRYWIHHVERAGCRAELFGPVYDFLCHHFLHWLEVLGWLGKAYECLPMLRALRSAVVHTDGSALQEFLDDAIKFVQSNSHIVSTAPLQLYSSAHVFTPQRGIVRRAFAGTTPSWISLQPEPELDWDDQCLQKLEGHRDRVLSVAFSHDSTLVVSSSADCTVRIWRADTGECIQELEGGSGFVGSVAFSHDSALIVSIYDTYTARIWRTDTGECIQELEGGSGYVGSVAFSHDSALVVFPSDDYAAQIWRTDTGECIRSLEGHSDEVSSAAFSHDSTLVVSASWDQTVRVWSTDTGECIHSLGGHSKKVSSVAFSHDSALIVSASSDQTVRVWRTNTGECVQTLEGHGWEVSSAAFSHDSALIVSSSYNTIWLWSANTGECVQKLKGHDGVVSSVSFSHDAALIASASDDKTIRIWNTKTEENVRKEKGHGDAVMQVTISDDSALIASSSDNTIRVWRADTGDCLKELTGHSDSISSFVFSYDSALIASASTDKTVRVWYVSTGVCVKELGDHNDLLSLVAFSYNSALLASVAPVEAVRIWRTDTGECTQVLSSPDLYITSVVFSHDAALVVLGSFTGTLSVRRTDTGECTQKLEGHEGAVTSAVLSHDSVFAVSGSFDQTMRVWRVETGDCVRVVHTGGWEGRLVSSDPNNCLVTNIGVVAFADGGSGAPTPLPSTQACILSTVGLGVSRDGCWITWNDQNLLWLPAEFRSARIAVRGSTVVIGCASGRVLIFRFSEDALRLGHDG